MPVATFDPENIEHYELKSCPGGFVDLRPMPYGFKLKRQEMAGKLSVTAGDKRSKDLTGEMSMINAKVVELEFAECIVDHNLETKDGRKLNFKNASDVGLLHPRIGEEISAKIGEMNNFDEELGNSSSVSEPQSSALTEP